MKTLRLPCILGTLITALALQATALATPPTLEWVRQLGSNHSDNSWGVSADKLEDVYIAGFTEGALEGLNLGSRDAFLTKYDAVGDLVWTRQLGTSRSDASWSVSSDGVGNVYISGHTSGDLEGTNAGSADAFLSKYDSTGNLLWTDQLGTISEDASLSVWSRGLDSVYISGVTEGNLSGTNAGDNDAFLSKYNSAGDLQWTRLLGSAGDDWSRSVTTDGLGYVYISGWTSGDLEGPNAGSDDAFLSKYDASGNFQWTKQLGTGSEDESWGVSADGLGNVYISGFTWGTLGETSLGPRDAFLSMYDDSGNLQWTEQLGTEGHDRSYSVSADGLGNVYISGFAEGDLGGTGADGNDAFLSKFDSEGNLQWTEQLGTTNVDVSYSVSTDGLGNIYISGRTSGDLGGTNAGSDDAFVAKYYDPDAAALVPEPSALILALLGVLTFIRRVRFS